MRYDGGYLMLKQPLLKAGMHRHTEAVADPVPDLMLDATNIVQATPWRINGWLLDIMREAWLSGDVIGDMAPPDNKPLPPRFPDEVWEAMSKEARGAHKAKLAAIHGENARMLSKREALLRKLQIAEELRDRPAIWFPHNLDFRGRIYPLPQDLNPQGDDVARALLTFADGKPLGDWGGWWLAVAIANAFGHDKLTFEERVEWARSHSELLVDSATNPLDGRRLWATADEPWSALALCREWVNYVEYGKAAVSHAPINVDGSCNGLQHLSAMGLDPVGAKLTNLTTADAKLDLYSEVAQEVIRMVAEDAAEGRDEALNWLGKIGRKTVKRAVMTTPYGVTHRGVQDQLIADHHVDGLDGDRLQNASYLKDVILAAISTRVVAARDIMAYFQGVAKALSEADLPLCWKTPAGMLVQQSYYRLNLKKVDTLFGSARIQTTLWCEDENLGFNKRKQVLASAPNIIHSFDAAHLARTVVSARRLFGIKDFSLIHDSYGTHACDVDQLGAVLRREFVEIYKEDQLERFETEIKEHAPGVELPTRPPRGTFNIEEVLGARYFFS